MKKRLETRGLRLAFTSADSSETDAVGSSSATSLKPRASSLVVADLRKSFRGAAGGVVEVLRGVSFAAEAGEMSAVVGASGAGKSTLLHVLGGLEAADAGSARLGGFDITRAGAGALARFRRGEVGFVFQSHRLLADLSAEENVALPLLVARRRRGAALVAAREMLAAVGLAERAAHAAGELVGRRAAARGGRARARHAPAPRARGRADRQPRRAHGRRGRRAPVRALPRGARLRGRRHAQRAAGARLRPRLTLREGRVSEEGRVGGELRCSGCRLVSSQTTGFAELRLEPRTTASSLLTFKSDIRARFQL